MEPFNVGDIEKMFQVNVLGVVYSLEAVLPQMLQRRRGHIAAISSIAAYKGLPGESGYTSSKAALNVFMEGLRVQLRSKGIAVTTICPGFVHTPMTEVNEFKMPWLLTADEAARRIVRALRRKRKVYNFPWQMGLFMRCAAGRRTGLWNASCSPTTTIHPSPRHLFKKEKKPRITRITRIKDKRQKREKKR